MSDNDWTPVTPIPVSEPPGDEDLVLLAIDHDMPGRIDEWSFDTIPSVWRVCRDLEFRFALPPHLRGTHYILLRKGE